METAETKGYVCTMLHCPLQKEYYATHQVFFSKRSLYLLVFDVTDGEEGIYGLKRWLENIEVGCNTVRLATCTSRLHALLDSGCVKVECCSTARPH